MPNSQSELRSFTVGELAERAGVATTSQPPSAPVPVTFSATSPPMFSTGNPVDHEPANAI